MLQTAARGGCTTICLTASVGACCLRLSSIPSLLSHTGVCVSLTANGQAATTEVGHIFRSPHRAKTLLRHNPRRSSSPACASSNPIHSIQSHTRRANVPATADSRQLLPNQSYHPIAGLTSLDLDESWSAEGALIHHPSTHRDHHPIVSCLCQID